MSEQKGEAITLGQNLPRRPLDDATIVLSCSLRLCMACYKVPALSPHSLIQIPRPRVGHVTSAPEIPGLCHKSDSNYLGISFEDELVAGHCTQSPEHGT